MWLTIVKVFFAAIFPGLYGASMKKARGNVRKVM